MHGASGRQILGQRAPLAAGAQNVHHAVDHLADSDAPFAAAGLARRDRTDTKNMMRIASGGDYNLWPFQHLVAQHAVTGARIAPNANKIMKDILGHADDLGLEKLKALVLETFDPELRNGYAHADYIVWTDGIRLRKRNGGHPSIVTFDEFEIKLNKAIVFFQSLRESIGQAMRSYSPAKRVIGRLNNDDPAMPTIIGFDEATGSFSIRSGLGL